jgi:hypothetical protein
MSKNLTLAMPIILTASVITMSASMTTSRAADECLSGPKGTAPAGSHWYYRVERSTGRHCWYLGALGQKVRSVSERTSTQTRKRVEQHSRNSQPAAQLAETRPSLPPSAPPVPDSKAATSFFQQYWASLFGRAEPPPIAPSAEAPQMTPSTEPLQITPPVAPPQTAQTAEAPRLAVPAGASRPTVASAASNYAQEQDQVGTQEDMPPVWPVLTAAQTKAAAGAGLSYQYMIAILVGALALAGILMALVYRLASIRVDRQRRQPERARWDPETRTMLPMPPLGDTNAFGLPRSGTPARRLLLPSPLLPKSEPDLDREPARRLPLPKLPFELGRELYEPVRPKLSTKLPHELAREARKPVVPQRPPELDREARKPILPKRPPELDRGSREPHEARRLRELRELREGLETRLEQLRDARRRSAA